MPGRSTINVSTSFSGSLASMTTVLFSTKESKLRWSSENVRVTTTGPSGANWCRERCHSPWALARFLSGDGRFRGDSNTSPSLSATHATHVKEKRKKRRRREVFRIFRLFADRTQDTFIMLWSYEMDVLGDEDEESGRKSARLFSRSEVLVSS